MQLSLVALYIGFALQLKRRHWGGRVTRLLALIAALRLGLPPPLHIALMLLRIAPPLRLGLLPLLYSALPCWAPRLLVIVRRRAS